MDNNDITPHDRELLRSFFVGEIDWMLDHLSPTNKDLEEFTQRYEEFINKNNLRSNQTMMLFLLELKCDQTINKFKALIFSNPNLIPKKPGFIQNGTIAKWYRISKLERHLFGREINNQLKK